jgi:hypothetical protein
MSMWFCLLPALTLVPCSAYSSTMKMEAICSFETSVDFQRTTRRYIPEDTILLLITTAVRTSNPIEYFVNHTTAKHIGYV